MFKCGGTDGEGLGVGVLLVLEEAWSCWRGRGLVGGGVSLEAGLRIQETHSIPSVPFCVPIVV